MKSVLLFIKVVIAVGLSFFLSVVGFILSYFQLVSKIPVQGIVALSVCISYIYYFISPVHYEDISFLLLYGLSKRMFAAKSVLQRIFPIEGMPGLAFLVACFQSNPGKSMPIVMLYIFIFSILVAAKTCVYYVQGLWLKIFASLALYGISALMIFTLNNTITVYRVISYCILFVCIKILEYRVFLKSSYIDTWAPAEVMSGSDSFNFFVASKRHRNQLLVSFLFFVVVLVIFLLAYLSEHNLYKVPVIEKIMNKNNIFPIALMYYISAMPIFVIVPFLAGTDYKMIITTSAMPVMFGGNVIKKLNSVSLIAFTYGFVLSMLLLIFKNNWLETLAFAFFNSSVLSFVMFVIFLKMIQKIDPDKPSTFNYQGYGPVHIISSQAMLFLSFFSLYILHVFKTHVAYNTVFVVLILFSVIFLIVRNILLKYILQKYKYIMLDKFWG